MIGTPKHTPFEETGHPTREKAPFIPWRLGFLGLVALTLITVFCGRIYYLTAVRGTDFFELSEDNFLRTRSIDAPRGKLLASDGTPISLNQPLYDVRISRFRLEPATIRESLARLAVLLKDPRVLDRTEQVEKAWPAWEPVVIASELTSEAVAPVIERLYLLPGVQVEPRFMRYHPTGPIAAHVSGHVGGITPQQLTRMAEANYLRTDLIGKLSAERQFESYLRGSHGSELTIHDAFGRLRSSHIQIPAERGNDVRLTIDMNLQLLADRLLEGHAGVLIVMDPRDGAIRALASKPDYDPNHPMRGIASQQTSTYNKAVRGLYAPASTFKLVTASAGLMSGFNPESKINCPGRFYLPNVSRPYYCDLRWGHGPLNMIEALQRSCNVFFYTWAHRLGHERLYETSLGFGFGQQTGIDLIPTQFEPAGILPHPSGKGIYRGSIIHMGIGQGSLISATPLQILGAYAALGNRGLRVRPHVLDSVFSPGGKLIYKYQPETIGELPVPPAHQDLLREGFHRVVHLQGGTGFAKGFRKEWDVAGKTGSGEVTGQELTNGLFVCYAPSTAPEIAMIGIIEGEGHGGSTALPLIVQLMAEYHEPGSGIVPEPTPTAEVAAAGASPPSGLPSSPAETGAAAAAARESAPAASLPAPQF